MDINKRQLLNHLITNFNKGDMVTLKHDRGSKTELVGKMIQDLMAQPYHKMEEVLKDVEISERK